jgi:hypothetical protein
MGDSVIINPQENSMRSHLALLALVLAFGLAATASAQSRVRCQVDENGAPAQARIDLSSQGRVVASGSCANPVAVPAGSYSATITLEGVLDRPTQTVQVTVPANGEGIARASFATSILEVVFTAGGQSANGTAILRRDGRDIGTLGTRVPVRVSAGSYQLVARYRTQERTFALTLAPAQRRSVRATF